MTQHNGEGGCATCEEMGVVVAQGKGHTRCYPYRSPVERAPPSYYRVAIGKCYPSKSDKNKGDFHIKINFYFSVAVTETKYIFYCFKSCF